MCLQIYFTACHTAQRGYNFFTIFTQTYTHLPLYSASKHYNSDGVTGLLSQVEWQTKFTPLTTVTKTCDLLIFLAKLLLLLFVCRSLGLVICRLNALDFRKEPPILLRVMVAAAQFCCCYFTGNTLCACVYVCLQSTVKPPMIYWLLFILIFCAYSALLSKSFKSSYT